MVLYGSSDSLLSLALRTLFLIGIFISPSARAQISLKIRADTAVRAPNLNVRVVVANIGKEAAYDFQLTLQRGSERTALPSRRLLAPEATYEEMTNLSIEETVPGRHPLFMTVGYTDANGYPFSSILCTTFFVERDIPSEVFGRMRAGPLEEKGQLYLQLKNVAQEEVSFGVTIFTPRELSVGDYKRVVVLGPNREASFNVPLRNFSALPGSRYPVYAVLEYEKDDVHYTSVIPAQIEVIAPISFFTRYRLWMVAIAGALFLIGILRPVIRSVPSPRWDEKGKTA